MNYDWAVQVFGHSSPEEVTKLLKMVGFGGLGAQPKPSLADALAAFLKTVDGQVELDHAKEAALKREADEWLRTRAGQERLENVKASLLAGELAGSSDVYEQACRREIQTQTTRWLQSPRGQEAIEQERHRIVKKQATQASLPGRKAPVPPWVEKQLTEAKKNA